MRLIKAVIIQLILLFIWFATGPLSTAIKFLLTRNGIIVLVVSILFIKIL